MSIDAPRPDLPPIHTQADLTAVWTRLMGELGFAARQLWVMFVAYDGQAHPAVLKIEDVPPRPDDLLTGNLVQVCAHFVDDDPANGRVALLMARPGHAGLDADDRVWASSLYRALRLGAVACFPLHFANDEELRLVALDDAVDGEDGADLGESA